MQRAKWLPLGTVITAFLLILWGGVVHNTQSSLACPDWPLCYGQFFPLMEDGVLIEHGHRLLGSLVGFFVLIGFLISWRRGNILSKHFHLFLLALILVVVQGVLGGITVIYRLPTIVSTTHLTLALSFLLYCIWLDNRVREKDYFTSPKLELKNVFKLKTIFFGLTAMVFVQVIFGAFIRHAGAGASCGLGFENSLLCFDAKTSMMSFWPTEIQAKLNLLHRLVGFIILFLVTFLTPTIFKLRKSGFGLLAIGLLGTVVFQVVMGILTVTTFIGPISTTLHLAGATLLLAITFRGYLKAGMILENSNYQGHSFLTDILELAKPKLSLLVCATAFLGMVAVPGHLDPFLVFYSFLGILILVMGAAILNCYLEKDVDAFMERTKDRAIVAGRMKPELALWAGIVLHLLSLGILLWKVNFLTFVLGVLGSFTYLFVYTPLKRKSELAVYAGAIPGALPVLMGQTTITGDISPIGLCLFLILLVWQIPHFLAIAIIYKDQYKKAGLSVFPNTIGVRPTIHLTLLNSVFLLFVSLMPFFLGLSTKYYGGSALIFGGIFVVMSAFGHHKTESVITLRSKYLFWYSIIFLPLMLASLIFLK